MPSALQVSSLVDRVYPRFTAFGEGFNYHFDSLNAEGKPNELNAAFDTMFRSIGGFALLPLIQAYFPPLRMIVCGFRFLAFYFTHQAL